MHPNPIKKGIIPVLLLAVVALMAAQKRSLQPEPIPPPYGLNSGLTEVLMELGDKKPLHYTTSRDTAMIRMGREIIRNGRTRGPDGKLSRKQSNFFTCTDCHNTAIEDPDLRYSNPDARLDYAIKNHLPFLQGTTLYGIVNRESWYNGDYLKKYGDLVRGARDTLMNAIDLCCTECAQGRKLESWEIKAVMHYLWSIQYKLKDLHLTPEQYKQLNARVKNGSSKDQQEAIAWFKQQFFTASPATFLHPKSVENRSLGAKGNAENGKKIYQASCQHCHAPGRVTHYILDENKLTFKQLRRHLKRPTRFSVYQITRKGTYAMPGYRPYMPQYTKERMSDSQLEDLVAYIRQQAGGNASDQ